MPWSAERLGQTATLAAGVEEVVFVVEGGLVVGASMGLVGWLACWTKAQQAISFVGLGLRQ